MDKDERLAFYEKLYFHEVGRIERISSRLSMPFAVLISAMAFLAFMLNSINRDDDGQWMSVFWLLFASSSIALALGAYFFKSAWFGHSDKLLPTASAIEEYYSKLVETYAEFEEKDELINKYFNDFLFDYYARFASHNAINNDTRSYNIYRALVSFTTSILLAFMAAIPFYFGGLQSVG